MYPFNGSATIVRDRWYVAAFGDDVTRAPIERTLLGKPVIMYRKEDGTPVAMYGLCPHRYFPLAKGRVEGDAIVCGYHGFTFAADGKCIDIPSQGTGSGFRQPVYPLHERGPLIWIWMGDSDQADPDLVPPYDDFGLGQPGWRYSSPNYVRIRGRAQLLIDNLMDLTHLPYLHHHIAGGDAMKKMPMHEEERPRSYRLVRRGELPWGLFHDLLWGAENRYEGVARFDSLTDFYGPELIRTGMPIVTGLEGGGPVPRELGILHILHGITPETERTTHYFGFSTRNFRLDDDALDTFQLASDRAIRQQDVDALEAVEERLDEAAEAQRELLVRSDGPAVKVRQKIQTMLDREG